MLKAGFLPQCFYQILKYLKRRPKPGKKNRLDFKFLNHKPTELF
jgi:hypothetical protein